MDGIEKVVQVATVLRGLGLKTERLTIEAGPYYTRVMIPTSEHRRLFPGAYEIEGPRSTIYEASHGGITFVAVELSEAALLEVL